MHLWGFPFAGRLIFCHFCKTIKNKLAYGMDKMLQMDVGFLHGGPAGRMRA